MKITSASARSGQLILTCDGEVKGTAAGPDADCELAARIAHELLLGEDPRAVTAHWARLARRLGPGSSIERQRAAALVDIALWDSRARWEGLPLWKALGGAQPAAVACALPADSGCEAFTVTPALGHWLEEYGIGAVLLPLGASPRADSESLEKWLDIASAPGAPDLLLSAMEFSDFEAVAERVRAIERRTDVVAVQVPFPVWGSGGCGGLSRAVAAAVCASGIPAFAEGLFNRLDHSAVDMLKIDCAISGITGALQLADAAYGFELPVVLAPGPAMIAAHVAGVLPALAYLEVPYRSDVGEGLPGEIAVRRGRVSVGNAPGNGNGTARQVGPAS